MSLPSVLLLGSGRIAYHLGHAFKRVGVPLVGIVGRNEETVKELSVALDTRSFSLSEGLPESSAVVICVSDQAIAEVAKLLPARNSAIIHTSGASSLDRLLPHENRAALWPIMTLSPGVPMDFNHVPIVTDSSSALGEQVVTALAESISTNVSRMPIEQRELVHAAAAISTNFPLFLLQKAEELLEQNGIDRTLIMPSFAAMAAKAQAIGARDALTGPARRGDMGTVNDHLAKLRTDPDLHRVYALVSRMILKAYDHPTDGIEDIQRDPR